MRRFAGAGRPVVVMAMGVALLVSAMSFNMTGVAASALAAPVIHSFAASPTSLPSGGGTVTLSTKVSNTTSCVFS